MFSSILSLPNPTGKISDHALKHIEINSFMLKKAGHRIDNLDTLGHLTYLNREGKSYRRGRGVDYTLEDGTHVYLVPGPRGWFLTTQDK